MLNRNRYRLRILRCLLPQAHGVTGLFALLLFLALMSTALSFATPIVYRFFIDEVILAGQVSLISLVALGYLGIYFAGVAIGYAKFWANCRLVNTTLYHTRLKILRNYLRMPFAAYETTSIGDLKLGIDDDTEKIKDFAGRQTIDYLIAYITLIVSALLLLYLEWRLALFAILVVPLTFLLEDFISKRQKALNVFRRSNDADLSAWLRATLQGWREVKAMNLEGHEQRRFYQHYHLRMRINTRWTNFWAIWDIIPVIKDEFLMGFSLYFFGGLLVMADRMTIGDLLVFAMYFKIFSDSVNAVAYSDAELRANMPFTDRLMQNLSVPAGDESAKRIVPDTTNTMVLDHVSFTYPNTESEVISDFCLQIGKGERVAITGKSGCGKTTLLKLLTGMVDPSKGHVLFSGANVSEIDLDVMHSRIGFVMQENILFNASIRENLLNGKHDATADEMREACDKAYILDFIDSLPDGFDTIIGERGIKLSGGQRQRLVLARVFLRDVDILIFDEATSALDQYSESIVQDAILRIGSDKTVIVVAHRESSIRLCDRRIAM